MVDYNYFIDECLRLTKEDGRYRVFKNITRNVGKFPKALYKSNNQEKTITIWCSNDYLGMGHNPELISYIKNILEKHGAGSGGTRNISGTNNFHVEAEKKVAEFHNKGSALLFTSGYVANEATLVSLGKIFPTLAIFSDSDNHASMIEGIKGSRCEKFIFEHNNIEHLEKLIANICPHRPKLIAFESVYSMDGDFGKINEIIKIAKKYNALTYLDEVHGIGLYGEKGAGLAQKLGVENDIDIIQGTMGKAIGILGGYVAASEKLIDAIRLHAPGFIFTTSVPPYISGGLVKSIELISCASDLRKQHQANVKMVKDRLINAGLPILYNESHIVPLIIGNSNLCEEMSNILLDEYDIYIQPINYPTVKKGLERLRITPNPYHSLDDIDYFCNSLIKVFDMCKNKINIEAISEICDLEKSS